MRWTMKLALVNLLRNSVVCWLSICFALLLFQVSAVSAGFPEGGLRGVYLKHKTAEKFDRAVGRIALRQVQGDSEQLVRLDHRFRSGDEFRIEVSSNHDGWLYLLHRQGDFDPQLLWPVQEKGGVPDENRLHSGHTYVIPTSSVIIFDQDKGTEFFYVAITEERGAPRLTTQGVKEVAKKAAAKPSRKEKKVSLQGKELVAQNQLVQIGVRSISQPPGNGTRTVVFDPGTQDPDRYLYFAAPEGGKAGGTLIEFQLRHD